MLTSTGDVVSRWGEYFERISSILPTRLQRKQSQRARRRGLPFLGLRLPRRLEFLRALDVVGLLG